MHTSRIAVYCRVRPTEAADQQHLRFLPDGCTVQVHHPLRTTQGKQPWKGDGYKAGSDGGYGASVSALSSSTSAPTTAAAQDAKSPPPQNFTVDGIFVDGNVAASADGPGHGANTQENVYATAVRGILSTDGVLGGTSATVLCYGAKGTGKSFTMFGRTQGSNAARGGSSGGGGSGSAGIVQRAIADLYEHMHKSTSASGGLSAAAAAAAVDEGSEGDFAVAMAVLQLQGERVRDMLACAGSHLTPHLPVAAAEEERGGRPAQVTLDGEGDVVLRNVRQQQCRTARDALACLRDALHAHRASPHSGYSHLVVSFHIQQRNLGNGAAQTRKSTLHFVDLAGTQSQRSAGEAVASPEERRLASAANQSLAVLQQVIVALGASSNDIDGDDENDTFASASFHGGVGRRDVGGRGGPCIPYRQSKLTTLLKDAMGGRCLTTLIVHIGADRTSLESSLHSLQFAKCAMRVAADPQANVSVDAASQVRDLQRQLMDLRAELRLQSQLSATASLPSSSSGVAQGTAAAAHSASAAGPAPSAFLQQRQQRANEGFPPTRDEVQQVHDKVHAYVDGSTASLQVGSVREMQACFTFLRGLVEERERRVAELTNEMAAVEASAAVAIAAAQSLKHLGDNSDSSGGRRRSSARQQTSSGSTAGRTLAFSLPAAHGASNGKACGGRGDVYTPSVLDTSLGVGYGSSVRAHPNPTTTTNRSTSTSAPTRPPLPPPQQLSLSGTNTPVIGSPTPPHLTAPPPAPAAAAGRTVGGGGGPPQTQAVNSRRPHTATAPLRHRPPSSRPATAAWLCAAAPPQRDALLATNSLCSSSTTTATSAGGDSVGPSDPAKAAAFEVYKATRVGAAQLRAMQADKAEVATLQRRIDNLQERLSHTLREEDGPPPPAQLPSHHSARQLGAACHTLQEQLTAAQSERAHLLRQLDHRRTGLLANFEEWYSRKPWGSGDAQQQVEVASSAASVSVSPLLRVGSRPCTAAAADGSNRGTAAAHLPHIDSGGGDSTGKQGAPSATLSVPTAAAATVAVAAPTTARPTSAAAGGR